MGAYEFCLKKHPLIFSALIGLLIRFAISFFVSQPNDLRIWSVLVENFRAGEGLYDVRGYYYTPIWGYFLEVITRIIDTFLNLGALSTRPPEALYLEDAEYFGTLSTPWFNLVIKTPLALIDVAVAFTTYVLMKRITNSEEKSVAAFAIWMLLPPAILTLGAYGMFDNIAALFLLLAILFLLDRKYVLTGAGLSLAFMTKFFPALAFFAMVPYIWRKEDENHRIKAIASMITSFVIVSIIIIIPQIINGELFETFAVLTNRLSDDDTPHEISLFGWALLGVAGIAGCILLAIISKFYKHCECLEEVMIASSTLIVGAAVLLQFNLQYAAEVLPLMIVLWLGYSHKLKWGIVVLSIFYIIRILWDLPSMLASVAYFTGIIPLDWLQGALQWERDMIIPDVIGKNANTISGLSIFATLLLILSELTGNKILNNIKAKLSSKKIGQREAD